MKSFGMHTSAFIIELPFQSFQIALQKDIICPVVHVNMFQILGSFLFLYRSRTLQIPIRILYIVLLTLYHLIPFVSSVWRRNGFGKTITPKGGKFSASESALVKEAVEKYCQSHGVTSSRLCSDADNRTDHLRGAWMEIAQALPHRTVQSVYRHGLRILHPFKRGTWSEEETKQLMLYVSTLGKKWSEIQGKLNRSADSCRDKYREFHQDYTKGKWGTEDSQKLEKLVRGYLKVGDDVSLKELGNIAEENRDQIPWSVISEKMGNRSR